MNRPEFVILGAGAIGSILAGHLGRAGHSVVVVARGERARKIRDSGLRVRGLAEFSTPVTVITEPAEIISAEVLIVAIKTPGTDAALKSLSHVDIGMTFSIQNGVLKDGLLSDAFGGERVLGAVADTSGELLPSGDVLFTRNANLLLGDLSGDASERSRSVAKILNDAGIRATSVNNIVAREWTKFLTWLPLMGLSVITRSVTWRYLTDPHCALLFVRIVREVASVARASEIDVIAEGALLPLDTIINAPEREAADAVHRLGEQFRRSAPCHRVSALQDLGAGRPLEVEETFGHAVRMAKRLNLAAPLLETFYHLISAIDQTRNDVDH